MARRRDARRQYRDAIETEAREIRDSIRNDETYAKAEKFRKLKAIDDARMDSRKQARLTKRQERYKAKRDKEKREK
jgi:hypothetical protein